MLRASDGLGSGRFSWRRELPPVLAVAGLAADYLSPPAAWTMVLPFGCTLLLLALGKRGFAAAVFLLSSWVFVPLAAQTVIAIEDLRGGPHLFVTPGATVPTPWELAVDPSVPSDVQVDVLPIGPGHLLDARWVLRDVLVTFVDLHNAMVLDRWHCAAGE
jgi:hypothetical protein